MTETKIDLPTWFDYFPTEILFHIFDYLSNNDIIYTFFFFNQRLNKFLLENKRYLSSLILPTTYFDIWKNLLSIIGHQIETLFINTLDLSFSLKYFTNLKSIIIYSLHGFPDEELQSIFESDLFNKLHIFKIKISKILSCPGHFNRHINDHYVIKIFNPNNSLKTFQYSFRLSSIEYICDNIIEKNFNLHSLTLVFTRFADIFILISYTPNLKYLNVQSPPPSIGQYADNKPIKEINIKLKEFHLTLNGKYPGQIDFDALIIGIKQFRLTLICLSINLASLNINISNDFPFNSIYLQQFLESMKELKQFHLYAKINKNSLNIDNENILSRFKTQFWFDHNWLFGMYKTFFYTLPFYFNFLYDFDSGFNHIKSNNPEINSRIWNNVTSIDLSKQPKYDLNFVKELKMKMPKLTSIKFGSFDSSYINTRTDIDKIEKTQITLNNVRTIECTDEFHENEKEWIIYALSNLTHLILYDADLPSTNSQLTEILNKKIQQLDIVSHYKLEQLIEKSYIYFSNVQYINCYINYGWQGHKEYAKIIMKILMKFKNLKTLLIYIDESTVCDIDCCMPTELNRLIKYLDIGKIKKNYKMKYYREYLLFSKYDQTENRISTGIVSSIWKIFHSSK